MIEVKHNGICLKLKKAVAEEHVDEVTAWLKDCAEKLHLEFMRQIDSGMKDLVDRLQIEDPTGEIYGRGPEDQL